MMQNDFGCDAIRLPVEEMLLTCFWPSHRSSHPTALKSVNLFSGVLRGSGTAGHACLRYHLQLQIHNSLGSKYQ